MEHQPEQVEKNTAIHISSEKLESTAAELISKWYTRCLLAGEFSELRSAARAYWDGIRGLEMIAKASPTAIHFQIYMRQQKTLARNYISEKLLPHYLEGKNE